MTGRLFASCGCEVPEADRTFAVQYRSQDCDAVDGFSEVTVYAEYCRRCTALLVLQDEFICAGTPEQPVSTRAAGDV